MNLVNWKYYDASILKSSSSANVMNQSNYDTTYMKNFKEKMQFVKRNNISKEINSVKHPICFAQFYPLFTEPVWIAIECNVTLQHVYFICESENRYQTRYSNYYRNNFFCNTKFTYGAEKCWRIVKQSTTTARPSSRELEELQDRLSAWSFGQESRNIVGIGNVDKMQYCLRTQSFSHFRLKTFIESAVCGNIKPIYTLVSRRVSTYSFICYITSQHKCDLDTCILNTYLCDGVHDCFDKSDENNCTVPLTSSTLVCPNNMGDLCDNHTLPYYGCADLYYECLSGECVPLAHLCDHHSHCTDNSDEVHCPSYKIPDIIPPISSKKLTLSVECMLFFSRPQIKDKSQQSTVSIQNPSPLFWQ